MTDTTTNDIADTDNIETTEIPMRVLKVASASSLSNRSTLGYAIGCDDDNAIHLSLRSNSAAGMFNKDWVAYSDVAELLAHEDHITSSTLMALFEGTSRNNAGFMLAVLLGEGLVAVSANKDRSYQRVDPKPFVASIKVLISSGVDLGDPDTPVPAPVIETPVAKRGRPKKA